jgi:ribosomal protein S12 methylthiotransferase accessory factor
VLDDERVLLLTETGEKKLLRGCIFAQLVPLLDGCRTIGEIVDALKHAFPLERIYFALFTLQQKGHIATVGDFLPCDERAYWHGLGAEQDGAEQRIRAFSIRVLALEETGRDALALSDALAKLRFKLVNHAEADLTVVLVPDYLWQELAEVNQQMFQNQKRWMPVKMIGQLLWIGPLFSADSAGCWSCLARRLRANRPEELIAQAQSETPIMLSKAALSATRAIGANLAALEIAKWITLGRCSVAGSVYTYDFGSLEGRFHKTPRFADCDVCGKEYADILSSEENTRVVLQAQPKGYTADGGHRVCSPEETSRA